MLGTYEYPDFPMESKRFHIKPGQHIPGETISVYLKAYADKFGITDKIRSCHKVIVAEHQETSEGGWFLTVADSKDEKVRVFARRLIIATGLTSEPWLPHFDGQESFGGRIFHGKYFQQNADTLETAKTVTIFGGTKFAWDAVYSYATAGVKVNWVIRCKSTSGRDLDTNSFTHSDGTWTLLDGTPLCHSTQKVVGKAC